MKVKTYCRQHQAMLRCVEPVERNFLTDPSMDYHPVAVHLSRANVPRAPGARLRGHAYPGHTALGAGTHGGAPLRGCVRPEQDEMSVRIDRIVAHWVARAA
ncbi:MAG: hypothetical protein M3495_15655 [Pseudomonadota bacterium]|nr:hypothetical protein [Gammaproteobacteria bacterium]MDQ3582937.1 hypothetical protein [Pseudomonadota bacterium]